MALDGIGQIFAALGTFAGAWAVLLLFRWFQRDFAAVYRLEVAELRHRVDDLEKALDARALAHGRAMLRISHLERALVVNGLPLPEHTVD